MKIAVFIKGTTFHRGYGGMETQNKILCEGLVERGHKVTVFSPKKGIGDTSRFEGGVEYVFIPSQTKVLFSRLRHDSWYKKSLIEFTKRQHEFDLVVSQSSAGFAIIDNKENLDVKVVAISHGTILSELKTYYLNNLTFSNVFGLFKNTQYALRQFFGRQRRFVLHANLVVAVSDYVRKQLLEETYLDPNKIEVIHNGINSFDKHPPVEKSDSVNLIYAGQLIQEKGSRLLVELANDKRFNNCVFHVFGEGADQLLLEKLLPRPNLKLYGKVSHEHLLDKFSQLENGIFLFPTNRIEGFPMVLVEAMFAGFAIVAFDLGGVGDAVVDGETGLVIKRGEKEIFTEAVLQLIRDQKKRDIMGKSALDKARKNFTANIMLDKYEKLFRKLTNNEDL